METKMEFLTQWFFPVYCAGRRQELCDKLTVKRSGNLLHSEQEVNRNGIQCGICLMKRINRTTI